MGETFSSAGHLRRGGAAVCALFVGKDAALGKNVSQCPAKNPPAGSVNQERCSVSRGCTLGKKASRGDVCGGRAHPLEGPNPAEQLQNFEETRAHITSRGCDACGVDQRAGLDPLTLSRRP
jgi:hypothetical protein